MLCPDSWRASTQRFGGGQDLSSPGFSMADVAFGGNLLFLFDTLPAVQINMEPMKPHLFESHFGVPRWGWGVVDRLWPGLR